MVAGWERKKVSWASRAGCCWGWKRVSKFQKELSTKELVGISSKPISRKISRKALLTLRSGWRWPDVGCVPSALKLYSLNVSVSHAPLHPIPTARV